RGQVRHLLFTIDRHVSLFDTIRELKDRRACAGVNGGPSGTSVGARRSRMAARIGASVPIHGFVPMFRPVQSPLRTRLPSRRSDGEAANAQPAGRRSFGTVRSAKPISRGGPWLNTAPIDAATSA